jgi:hypothetical protein
MPQSRPSFELAKAGARGFHTLVSVMEEEMMRSGYVSLANKSSGISFLEVC